MTPVGGAGAGHGRIALNVAAILKAHVDAIDLGVAYAAETGFLLARDPDTVLAADCAFVRTERVATAEDEGYFPGPPDLAVEVVSPHDRVQQVEAKASRWLDAGARAVWIVRPRTRSVTVMTPGRKQEVLAGERLDGGDVVPGFRCDVDRFFA